ncbi:SDR family oxidoreductase [Planctomycetota bacterium]|nr:SDR family oxidoreductase [Planctomycetota bacterium]
MSGFLNGMTILVTGASDGIGAELAKELAAAGAGTLVLSGRDMKRLERTRDQCSVPCELVCADLSSKKGVESLLQSISHLEIDGLVNNAGVGLGGGFSESSCADQEDMIYLNCQSVMQLTHHLLDPMKKRGKGFILFVGSMIGFVGGPGMTTYSATKGFVNRFSETLRWELEGTGVRVTLLAPGVTRTSFFTSAGISEDHIRSGQMGAGKVAKVAVRGVLKRKATVIPGVLNNILFQMLRFVPRGQIGFVSRKMFAKIYKDTEGTSN